MKKLLIATLLLPLIFSGCKKEQLTPDGKPKTDAAKNILRVDARAAASYWLSVAEFDPSKGQNISDATFYLLKNGLTTPYECTFVASPGNVLFIEVYTSGPSASCDIYYKGVKVTSSALSDVFNSNNNIAPSHTNITYEIPK